MTTTPRKRSNTWQTRDIVIASVVAVASGLIFWLWTVAIYPALTAALIVAPEFQSLFGGGWLIAGVLGGLIVRKPGAAIYCEVLAALIEAILGTHLGWTVVISGIAQGVGAELIFALFLYRQWNLVVALLAGALSGVAMGVNEVVMYYAATMDFPKMVVYTVCGAISGIVVAGLFSWLAMRGIAQTGAVPGLNATDRRRERAV